MTCRDTVSRVVSCRVVKRSVIITAVAVRCVPCMQCIVSILVMDYLVMVEKRDDDKMKRVSK